MRTPKFTTDSGLVRYIPEANRLSGNRPSTAAFLPEPTSANSVDDHLSVNSLEIETRTDIARYYRWKFQGDRGRVALCIHKLHQYNGAGRKSGVQIQYDYSKFEWEFVVVGNTELAYRHRPVPKHNNPYGSASHCGVEFVRALAEHEKSKFARRLSARGKFHLF